MSDKSQHSYYIECDAQGMFTCLECGFSRPTMQVVKMHWEAKHGAPAVFACQYCDKETPSQNALRSHVSRYHRERK